MLLALEGDPDAPDILTPCSYAKAITGRYSSQWQAAMDAEMASWKSTGTYVSEVPPPGANIGDGMWIFRVKRPPGSPPAFKARYVARGTSTPRPPTPSIPLTKLLGRQGLTGARLLLALATTKASTLRGCTLTSVTATSTTAAAASTSSSAASTTSTTSTEAPTPGTTPTSIATPFRLLLRLHRRPRHPLHHPCSPCPCYCGASHQGQTQLRPPQCQRGRQQQQKQQRGEGGQGNTPQRKGCDSRCEKHLQIRCSSQLQ
ncbi:unnamed protein product [Closterium sp. NIES-54]